MLTVAFDARDAADPQLRGWGRYARELLLALGRLDDLEVVALGQRPRLPELAWEQLALPLALRRLAPDLVHTPNCFLPLARPCPGVVSVLDLAFEAFPGDFAPRTRWKYATVTPRAARSAERVIAISQATADDLVARYGIPSGKVRVIGLAPALLVGSAPVPGGEPYLLAVGDLRAKKNLRRLVSAFARLRGEGTIGRLVLAGVDAGEGALLDGPGVERTGWVSDGELDALLRGAAAVVHPSLYEGFGLVVVEAMARGVPVACANTTSLPEAAGGAAVLFDPLDVDDMAAAIGVALRDRSHLVAAGHSRVAGLSWDATARATRDVYRELTP